MNLNVLRPVLVVMLILSVVSFALATARHVVPGATDQVAIVSVENTAPVIAPQNVPPMTVGYDVICNLSTARQSTSADTSAWLRLRTPVDWRSNKIESNPTRLRPAPAVTLLD